jgi:hypothetical protein
VGLGVLGLLVMLALVEHTVEAAAVQAVVVVLEALVAVALFVLFGPVILAPSHQQTQETCNGIIYSNPQWSTV